MHRGLHPDVSSNLTVVSRWARFRSPSFDRFRPYSLRSSSRLNRRSAGLLALSACLVCNSRRTNPTDCADEPSTADVRLIEFRDSRFKIALRKCQPYKSCRILLQNYENRLHLKFKYSKIST